MPAIQIMPSLLAANMGRLEEEILLSQKAGSDGIHLDIMDGHFVPNISMGPDIVKMSRDVAPDFHRSVHLMITRPDKYADAFIDAGADTLLIHVEADADPGEVLAHIKRRGIRAGITLNPETPAEAAFPYLDQVDEILCMPVHPGFGGQAFIKEVLPKMAALRARAPKTDISVDGGLNLDTAILSAERGANIILAGTSLFRADDMKAAISEMREKAQAALDKAAV